MNRIDAPLLLELKDKLGKIWKSTSNTKNLEKAAWYSTAAFIDIPQLIKNYLNLSNKNKQIFPNNNLLIPVIKANAYGHDKKLVSAAIGIYDELTEKKYSIFAVETIVEAVELRVWLDEIGLKNVFILMMNAVFSNQLDILVKYRITPALYDETTINFLIDKLAKNSPAEKFPVFLKFNSGMNRLGVDSDELFLSLITKVNSSKSLKLEGLMTHLSVADSYQDSHVSFTHYQVERFLSVLEKVGSLPPIISFANSAATINLESILRARRDLLPRFEKLIADNNCYFTYRTGISLYGHPPDSMSNVSALVKPVLTLKSRVSQVRNIAKGESTSYTRSWIADHDCRIATVPVGYGDGLTREQYPQAQVLINAKYFNIIHPICMGQCIVMLDQTTNVKPGDEVILIGKDSDKEISAEVFARAFNTINYVVLTHIMSRVPRIAFF